MNKLILEVFMVVSVTTLSFMQQVERPNTAIVFADDLGWGDAGFHGSEIEISCLNALAAEGAVLDRFYTAPISTSTCVGLMIGCYPNRSGIHTIVTLSWHEDGLDENEEIPVDMLARNGYSNRAIIGKWYLGHTWKVHYPINRGFSHFYGHLNGAIDYFDHTREGELDWYNDWETCHDKGYSTELITQEAVRCINIYEKEGPFLLYVAYNAPHTPLQAQEKGIELHYDDFGSPTPKEQRRVTHQAMMSYMDRGIGTIVDALKREGIMDNTFLIFFSDNGPVGVPGSPSGKLRDRKFDEWDGGVCVPAAFYWKRAESNYKNLSSQVTGLVGIVSTLKELVEDKNRPERACDGTSILPLSTGSISCIDRNFYLGCGAVVNKDYKLIRKGRKPGLNLPQDFPADHQTDPYGKKNAPSGNEQITRSLYQVALKYDTITPCLPEIPYDKGCEGFKAPVEWKVTR